MSKINIIPIFVPHLGCPNDCIFCNQRRITNQEDVLSKEQITEYIDEYLSYFKKIKNNTEIAFYGGSFTGLPKERMEEYLKIAKEYIDKGSVSSIRLSTRPDYIDDQILEILNFYGVKTIELGIQSMNDDVLMKNHRGHSSKDIIQAIQRIRKAGFKLGLQMMVGLYGDIEGKASIDTAKKFLELEPDFVRIYPTLIIKDTLLEKYYKKGKYQAWTLEQSVEVCKELYILFRAKKIPIIRMGLQSTEGLQNMEDMIAGPFHAAFRQLVEERFYDEIISEYFEKNRIKEKKVIILTSKEIQSFVIGNKAKNKLKWMERYQPFSIKFLNKNIKKENLEVQINEHSDIIDIEEYIQEKYFKLIRVGEGF